MNIVDKTLENIISTYPDFVNVIENYFKKEKYKYFINGQLNYNNIPKDCRSNSYLENYNCYIKKKFR